MPDGQDAADAIARWLGEQVDRPPVPFEKVEPGNEQVLPEVEQRELDAVPSRRAHQRGS